MFCHGFERRPPPCWLHRHAEGGEQNEPDQKVSRRRRGCGVIADGRCHRRHDRWAAGSQRCHDDQRRDDRCQPERRFGHLRAERDRGARGGRECGARGAGERGPGPDGSLVAGLASRRGRESVPAPTLYGVIKSKGSCCESGIG
ncbi:MAG: hypothetical protein E6I25_08455 [Chloroflexi bacterium]|nr:MAG: hypothetical protein E6I25_08455 [Chloroflexota bacterium]